MSSPRRIIPVNWYALEFAFQNNAPGRRYLALASGRVIDTRDELDPANFVRIVAASPREQYRWIENFAASVLDPTLRATLAEAIRGERAFRRFKDMLVRYPDEYARWRDYRDHLVRALISAWIKSQDFVPASAPPWMSPDEPFDASAEASGVALPEVEGPDDETEDALRRRARELLESMPAGELPIVIAYLRFTLGRASGSAGE